ncbi:MAG: LysM domain-containing protein [Anaerolineaceae bacterium]|jgi:LysM repeat protein|nr:LysM domain-containing protein [Anaerolineaceae bacterium]
MIQMKRSIRIACMAALSAILIAGCNRPYSTPPAVTNTPIDKDSFFSTPAKQPGGQLSDAEIFATQTAQGMTPSAPHTATPGDASQDPTVTLTPFVQVPTAIDAQPTATLAVSTNAPAPTSASIPSGNRPATYTLQSQEFPFCIARRYNLDPDSLLAQNGLSGGTVLYAGYQLTLSNVASPFPGNRALRAHPASYTVSGDADTTVYGVACKFGDVTPEAIVAANSGVSLGSTFSVGQTISIP